MVYSTDQSKVVVPVLVLLFVAFSTRRFVLCLTLCHFILVFSILSALRLPRLGKRELILVLFVRLFDLCLFGFVSYLFLLVSGKAAVCDCGTPWTFLLPCLWRLAIFVAVCFFLNCIHLVRMGRGYFGCFFFFSMDGGLGKACHILWVRVSSGKLAYIILTPLNPNFI